MNCARLVVRGVKMTSQEATMYPSLEIQLRQSFLKVT